jgi:hypothetical protein
MKNIFYIFLVSIASFNCSAKNDQKKDNVSIIKSTEIKFPINLDLEKGFDSEESITLNSLIDSIRYIQLQTTPISYVKRIHKIVYYKNHFYIGGFSSLLQFDDNGKFIQQIGEKGKGPGEYIQMRDFIIQSDIIYINGRNKVLEFSTRGDYIKEYPLPLSLYFQKMGDTFISFDSETGKLDFFSKTGELIRSYQYEPKKINPKPVGMIYDYENYFFSTREASCLNTFHNDTIHQINSDKGFSARYIINLGKYKLPEKYRYEYLENNFFRLSSSYLRPVLLETENYLFVQFCIWGVECKYPYSGLHSEKANAIKTGVYIKKTGQFNLLSENENTGIAPLFFPYFTDGQNYLISYIEAFEAIEYFKTGNKSKNQSLFLIAKNLKVTDNPILMLAKLKQ